MNRRRIAAVTRKEFLHIVRDARSLILALCVPVLLLWLFGWALALDVDDVATVVLDRSRTPQSRDLVSYLDGGKYISVIGFVDSYEEMIRAIDTGKARVGLTIPDDFAQAINTAETAKIQVIVDGTDSNTARLAIVYVEASAQLYGAEIQYRRIFKGEVTPVPTPVKYEPRALYNPTLESRNYIIPGLIALVMMVIAALLTSLTVAREWERGTMEQLISTPVRGPELIIGKLIPYWLIGMFDVIIAILMGVYIFGVPLKGSPVLVLVIAGIFLLGALSMGMSASITFKNQVLAAQMALMGTYLPTLFLAGFVFAISNMPVPLQLFSYIVPSRYFISLLRSVFLKGVGLEVVGTQALLLTAFSFFVFMSTIKRFKKTLI